MATALDGETKIKTKLFIASVLQPKEELEERLEKQYNNLQNISSGLSDREAHDALTQAVSKGPKEHEDICMGLLFAVLTESATASKTYRDMAFISRDGLQMVVNKLSQIINEKYLKLLEGPKIQILWLLGEMMKNSISGLDGPVHFLIRNIAGGGHSPGNIWLTENVFKLIKANKVWLNKNLFMYQAFVLKYLRTIEDHDAPRFKALRQAEVDFVVLLIREKFMDCAAIGRDLIRLIQNIARIPEIQKLWKDMVQRPQSLASSFTGLPQILNVRTHRKYLQILVTPDMETKIAWLVLKVKFGNQRRYQEWFFRQYLSAAESQSIIPDLIRFICGVIHPPNEVLCSDIIPRWAVIGWLYTACQNHASQTNVKLALFYDWLFFQRKTDNIMNIEPAVLLMYNSLRNHMSMTFSLLEFICRMTKQYCPQFTTLTHQGVLNSWKAILEMRVISSLSPILKNHRMEKELKLLVQETFPTLIGLDRQNSTVDEPSSPRSIDSPPLSPTLTGGPLMGSIGAVGDLNRSKDSSEASGSDTEAVFSDGEEDEKQPPPPPPLPVQPPLPADTSVKPEPPSIPPPKPPTDPPPPIILSVPLSSKDISSSIEAELNQFIEPALPPHQEIPTGKTPKARIAHTTPRENNTARDASKLFKPIVQALADDDDEDTVDEGIGPEGIGIEDVTELEEFQQIDSNLLKDNVVKLKNELDHSSRCEAMEAIISNVESMGDFDEEVASPLCTCLSACLAEDLFMPCLPKKWNQKSLEDMNFDKPHHVIFRQICGMGKNNRDNLYLLLNGIHEVNQKIGYHFLFYLKSCHIEKMNIYEDYISYFKDRTLKSVLTDDMQACFEYDPKLFMNMVELVFDKYGDVAVGNKDLVHMLCSAIHPDELNHLISEIALGDLMIIGENQVGSLLVSSLQWTSFEQTCLWRIITAEDAPAQMIVGLLPELKSSLHSEAVCNLLLLLKKDSPSMDILKPLYCMELVTIVKKFSLCLLKQWLEDEPRELATNTATLLNKPSASNKRRNKLNPSPDQIVLHINQLYKHMGQPKDFALNKYESFRSAMLQAKKNMNDPDVKTKCKNLLTEFSDLPDRLSRKRAATNMSSSRNKPRVARGRGRGKTDDSSDESDDESDDDEEEDDDEEDEEDDNDSNDDDRSSPSPNKRSRSPAKKKRRTQNKNLSSDEDD